MNKQVELTKILLALAEYYERNLSPSQIAMYVEDLMCLEPEKLIESIKRYRNDPKNDRFPLPVKLKAMIGEAESPDDHARDASSRIVAAVSKYGWNNLEQAKAYIGDLGWEVVKRHGGWQTLCESLTYSNMGMLQAQWRELAASIQRSGATQSSGPALPPPPDNQPKLTHIFKEMPK
jgi:hypothetical protein